MGGREKKKNLIRRAMPSHVMLKQNNSSIKQKKKINHISEGRKGENGRGREWKEG